MEFAVVALSVALVLLAVACTVLGCAVPFLYWKCFRLEGQLRDMDDLVAELCKALGLKAQGDESPK